MGKRKVQRAMLVIAITLAFLVLVTEAAGAVSAVWTRRYGGAYGGNDGFRSLTKDMSGNVAWTAEASPGGDSAGTGITMAAGRLYVAGDYVSRSGSTLDGWIRRYSR